MSTAPLDIPIVTPANDISESDNSDSDLDFEGETEGKNIPTEYLNTGKFPTRLHGVYLYPQDSHVHGHTWTEYPDEPCSPQVQYITQVIQVPRDMSFPNPIKPKNKTQS